MKSNFAFIVAVSDYHYITPLSTPINDATSLASVLKQKYDFHVTLCINPSKSKFWEDFSAFQQLTESQNKGDNQVLIYFAGHGIAKDSENGLKGYLLTQEVEAKNKSTWLPMEEVLDACNRLVFKHQVIILDCCFSGAFRQSAKFRDLCFEEDAFYRQHYYYFMQHTSQQVLTSASQTQKALDVLGYREEQAANSPFAAALVKGLEGAADTNNDKVLTLAEIYNYLQQRVTVRAAGIGHEQNVGLFPLERHKNGEFLFIPHDFSPEELTEFQYQNPYKGLNSYEPEDKQLFFGRENAIQEIQQKLQKLPLLVVIGASGTGKSSLIKAGIVPELTKKEQRVTIIRPTQHPLSVLPENLNFDVLMIDQLEELVTQADEKEVQPFLDKVRSYIEKDKKQVIITLRIDFETQIIKESLEPYWTEGRYLVPLFSAEELREIIITPAARVGRFIEPIELVDEIIEEVIHYPGALPLLSFTMSELFSKCEGSLYRNITEKDYKEMGGVTGALQKTADKIYNLCNSEEKNTLKNMLLRMVSLSGGETAGKRVFLEELIFEDATENTRIEKLKTQLIEARLIRANRDNEENEYIEPAHDALVRTWKRLQEWIKEVKEENILLQNKLGTAVAEYNRAGAAQKAHLWDNSPSLEQTQAAQQSQYLVLNQQENVFVRLSVQAKKRARNIRYGLIGAAFVIISSLAGFGFWQAGVAKASAIEANIQRDSAKAQKVIAIKNADSALSQKKVAEKRLADFLAQKRITDSLEAERLFKNAESYIKSEDYKVAYNTLRKADSLNPNNPKILQKKIDVQRKL
ncbi:MAG: caspase family protein [Bacteroidia bacterium]